VDRDRSGACAGDGLRLEQQHGCGAHQAAGANVTGNWNGGFYGALSNSVSMQLQQQGTAVTATSMSVAGQTSAVRSAAPSAATCSTTGSPMAEAGTMQVSGNVMSGTISGNAFRAQKQ
jgi:hypothetical protein